MGNVKSGTGVTLWVEINKQDFETPHSERGADIDRGGGLANTAFLIGNGNYSSSREWSHRLFKAASADNRFGFTGNGGAHRAQLTSLCYRNHLASTGGQGGFQDLTRSSGVARERSMGELFARALPLHRQNPTAGGE